jgi:hypothetical protein
MNKKYNHFAWAVMLFGFILRLVYVQFYHPIHFSLYSDMENYVSVADMILKSDWRVTHFFQPIGFPYLLTILKTYTANWTTTLGWIHILTSTLSLYFIWKLSKEMLNEKMALVVLGISAIHLPWIIFTGFALTENLFIFFLSALAWMNLKLWREEKVRNAGFWAFLFLMAFLMKGTHIFLAPLVVITLLFNRSRLAFLKAVIITFIIAIGLLGHGLLTQSKIGRFQLSASAGGLNFVEGKCPIKNNADSAGYSWFSPLYFQLGLDQKKYWDHPFTDSKYFMQEGFKCIKNNPLVLIQSLEGIPFLFTGNTLWPANQLKLAPLLRFYELFFAIFCYVGLAVYAHFFIRTKKNNQDFFVWVLPVLSLFVCVYIFKSEIRFRIPFDLWIIPVAVKGWFQLWSSKIT